MRGTFLVIAAVVSVGFLVLSVPYLVLTTIFFLQVGTFAAPTVIVYVAFALASIALVAFWVRKLRRRNAK